MTRPAGIRRLMAFENSSGPKKKGSVLWTEKAYGNFMMELEFRFGEGVVDSGVHVRNKDQIQIGISGSLSAT